MKWLWLSILILLLQTVGAAAQNRAGIAASNMNILYAGIYNSVDVVVCGYECGQVLIDSDNGHVLRNDDCSITAIPDSPGRATIRVFRVKKGDTDFIQRTEFRVRPIPAPVARIGGKTGGSMRANVLKAQLGVAATLEGLDICAKCEVTNYSLTLMKVLGEWMEFRASSPYFTPEMQSALMTVSPGDRVLISQIRVRDLIARSKEIDLAPIVLTVE